MNRVFLALIFARMDGNDHKAGFVSIIGKPNTGKSTLLNQLVGEKLAIITSKAQTTRHRILGIVNGKDFQIVYSDTPGFLKPKYELHNSMMRFVNTSLADADLILYITELGEKHDPESETVRKLANSNAPIIQVLNKTDLGKGTQVDDKINYWKEIYPGRQIISVSALKGTNVDTLLSQIVDLIPQHPPYYPKDEYTDKPERFFAAEIVREKIFNNYSQEIPYSCEVVIEEFKEDEKIIRMRALIFVERNSQKGILIGKGGSALKKVGIQARKDLENIFGKQVHLETFVKVDPDWRKSKAKLRKYGYN